MERKLAVILSADVAGYSRLVAADEESALATLNEYRATISDLVSDHRGRIFGTAGDSVIAEFQSAVQGIRAAVAIQRALRRRNADLAPERRMEFRIGLHLCDVVAEGEDLLGDGINVAARLQEIAEPGEIRISGALREQIEGKLDFPLAYLGEYRLKNLPRSVPVHRVDWRLPDSAAPTAGGPPALPAKPSIAVLPFVNMSGDSEQEYFADGLTEDLITALSHYRWFFVIARNSSFAYKGRALDVKRIAAELGVRYVVEGSVRKAGERVRVSGQLIDAETGTHIWAERYDRDLADIFAIQDELTQNVVGAIEPEMMLGESRRALSKPTDNLDAYDCCMRGTWHHYQFTAEDSAEALRWFRKAIQIDPDFGRAHMALARTLLTRCVYGFSDDIDRDHAEICAEGSRAVALDDRDPYAHYVMFGCHRFSGRSQLALAAAQRAIDLNPNLALGQLALGSTRIMLGHFAEALEPLHTALRLSPNDPLGHLYLSRIALAHYHLGNYKEAVHHAERALASRRVHFILVVLLASLGQLGRLGEARALLPEIAAAEPVEPDRYWQYNFCYDDPANREHLFEGLRKGGLTEFP